MREDNKEYRRRRRRVRDKGIDEYSYKEAGLVIDWLELWGDWYLTDWLGLLIGVYPEMIVLYKP